MISTPLHENRLRCVVGPLGAAALVLMAWLVMPVAAAAEVTISEWDVPWENSRPRDPYVGPDGRVWFVGQAGHYVAVFDPGSEQFKRYDLDDGAGPHNLIVGDDGTVWYAGNRAAHIGRLDPDTGEITKIGMPDPDARDPHTLVFDADGNIWFTLQFSNKVGFLDTDSHEVGLLDVPTRNARPYGIEVDGAGTVWVVLFGSNKLARITPPDQLQEIALPRDAARPRRLALTSGTGDASSGAAAVWYVDFAGGRLGRFDTATGDVEEWPSPGGERSGPYGMAIDDQDRIWYVETGPAPNQFVGFDTGQRELIGEHAIDSGAGAVRHMHYDASSNSVWFGTDANTLGRARLGD